MFYANSETILNNDRFFSPYIVESYPHQKEKSFNNYLLDTKRIIALLTLLRRLLRRSVCQRLLPLRHTIHRACPVVSESPPRFLFKKVWRILLVFLCFSWLMFKKEAGNVAPASGFRPSLACLLLFQKNYSSAVPFISFLNADAAVNFGTLARSLPRYAGYAHVSPCVPPVQRSRTRGW